MSATKHLDEGIPVFEYYDEAKKEFLDGADPKWKQACIDKFMWIKVLCQNQAVDGVIPADLAMMSDEENLYPLQRVEKSWVKKDPIVRLRREVSNQMVLLRERETTMFPDHKAGMSWRDLFIKLTFEEMLKYFPEFKDFKLFY